MNRVPWFLALIPTLALSACGRQVTTDRTSPGASGTARGLGRSAAANPTPTKANGADGGPYAGDGSGPPTLPLMPPAGATYTTILYSERDADVTARMDGVVASVRAELGDRVTAGEELARLVDDKEQAAVASAQAAVDLARQEHDRVSQLADKGMASPADLEDATYRLRTAEAALQSANVQLGYTRIRAPFDGEISRRYIRLGQSVKLGDPLFRTTAPRPLRAQVDVPELQAQGVVPGRAVRLQGVTGERTIGRVLRVSPAVDPASGAIELLVGVEHPGGLRPGSTVTVKLLAADSAKAAR